MSTMKKMTVFPGKEDSCLGGSRRINCKRSRIVKALDRFTDVKTMLPDQVTLCTRVSLNKYDPATRNWSS